MALLSGMIIFLIISAVFLLISLWAIASAISDLYNN